MIEFNHFNFNVLNLEKSIAFYKEAIGLSVVREKIPVTEASRLYILETDVPALLLN